VFPVFQVFPVFDLVQILQVLLPRRLRGRGLVLLVSAGLAIGLPALAAAPPTFEPAGRLVRTGEDVLHVVCTGQGAPTIVLEAGAGGNYLEWSLVQPEIAHTNRVCSYDRAGIGWSRASTRPRTIDNIDDELHRTIAAADIARPFVLIGHSFGGLTALHYARRYPAEIAGLILLDPTHPDQFRRFNAIGVTLPEAHVAVLRTPLAASIYGLPTRLHGLAIHLASAPTARRSTIDEMTSMPTGADAVREEGYPRVPARIIIHGNREWDRLYPDGRMEDAWADMQAELARNLGAPLPISAASSGHQIALDRPDLVVGTLRDLIRSARLMPVAPEVPRQAP
jgi:pimeloyl-ACP methyl ester carboxylesterase